jgi:hypothetical protein
MRQACVTGRTPSVTGHAASLAATCPDAASFTTQPASPTPPPPPPFPLQGRSSRARSCTRTARARGHPATACRCRTGDPLTRRRRGAQEGATGGGVARPMVDRRVAPVAVPVAQLVRDSVRARAHVVSRACTVPAVQLRRASSPSLPTALASGGAAGAAAHPSRGTSGAAADRRDEPRVQRHTGPLPAAPGCLPQHVRRWRRRGGQERVFVTLYGARQ